MMARKYRKGSREGNPTQEQGATCTKGPGEVEANEEQRIFRRKRSFFLYLYLAPAPSIETAPFLKRILAQVLA
jgi:hypothetical protein